MFVLKSKFDAVVRELTATNEELVEQVAEMERETAKLLDQKFHLKRHYEAAQRKLNTIARFIEEEHESLSDFSLGEK